MVRRGRGGELSRETAEPAKRIKVVIADDHALLRRGLETVLLLFDDIELVAQAEDGAAGRRCV